MPVQAMWIFLGLAVLAIGILGGRWARVWLRFRGSRVITCPENRSPAGVHVDERHAALSALRGAPFLRLSACSRWPERQGCGQACLAQIEASPEGCLVRNILAEWYLGKVCVCCGLPFGEIRWAGQKPALIWTDKTTVEWDQVPAERLPAILETALPVCFACHMANTLVQEHPELALDRGAQCARRIST
jgi:hypothetical protein